MTDSLFGDLDVASAEDNPFGVPDDTYEAYLTEAFIRLTKDKTKKGLNLVFKISEGERKGRTVKEWKEIPSREALQHEDDEIRQKANEALSFLKLRLKELGVPSEKMNTIAANDLIGKHVKISVVTANGYTNIRRLVLVDENTAADFAGFS